jgi:hypothetical protein
LIGAPIISCPPNETQAINRSRHDPPRHIEKSIPGVVRKVCVNRLIETADVYLERAEGDNRTVEDFAARLVIHRDAFVAP